MTDKLPRSVPLPEVAEYTEDILFENLHLPVGFDEERLLVNLRAMEYVRKIGILDLVDVQSFRPERENYDAQTSVASSGGAAMLIGVGKRQLGKLTQNEYTKDPDSFRLDVDLRINTTEIEARIKDNEDKYEQGLVDPKAWAKYLNKSLKSGLTEAVYQGCFEDATLGHKLLTATPVYAALISLLIYKAAINNPQNTTGENYITGVTQAFFMAQAMQYGTLLLQRHPVKALRELPPTLVPLLPIDRYLAATGLAKSAKLIKVRA